MTYVIEPVNASTAGHWESLRNRLWEGEAHRPEIQRYFRGELAEPNEVLLAFDQLGRAVGHVELSIRTDVDGLEGIKTGYIEGLFVEDSERGSLLVAQLLRASEAWASAQGCVAFASDRDDRIVIHKRFVPTKA